MAPPLRWRSGDEVALLAPFWCFNLATKTTEPDDLSEPFTLKVTCLPTQMWPSFDCLQLRPSPPRASKTSRRRCSTLS